MRTTLNIDDKLMNTIMKLTDVKSKTQIINQALTEYLSKLNRESIKNVCGKLDFDLDVRKYRNLDLDEA